MSARRMFSKAIIDSDAFLEMPTSTQALYFHLGMRADDDGFVNNPKKIQRMINCSDDDLRLLLAKRYIIPFESGVCVVKHWRMHNYIPKDRYKPTMYQDEKALLTDQENGVYGLSTDCIQPVYIADTNCIQSVDKMDTQVRLGKGSLGKVSIGEVNTEKGAEKPTRKKPVQPEKIPFAEYVTLTQPEYDKLIAEIGEPATLKAIDILNNYKGSSGKKYASDYLTIKGWVLDRIKEKHPDLLRASRKPVDPSANPFDAMIGGRR